MDVFIDSNALTLLLLGTVNSNYIGSHSKLSAYNSSDYYLVASYMIPGNRLITTPNIWTEVDNHCNGLKGDDRFRYGALIKRVISDSLEKYVESKIISDSEHFLVLGLADTLTLYLAQQCHLLITGDSQLADYARAHNVKLIDLKLIANERLR